MAFVNERSENDSECRTIDYERGAILRWTNLEHLPLGPRTNDKGFVILWKEKKIELVVVPQRELFEVDGSRGRVTYYVSKCHYPEELRPYRPEIIQMVIEGLTTYGVYYGSREGTETVVQINPRLINLNSEPFPDAPPLSNPSKDIH